MITDKECREIAENLRREILYTRGSLGDWWMRLHEAVTGSEDFPCPQETMSAIADLIDRPTCAIVESYMGDNLESVEETPHHVLSCGHIAYGEDDPMFCQVCGAAVTDDYR